MSRPLLISLIVILAASLGWVSYDELRRREALANQHLQNTKSTMQLSTTSSTTTEPLEPQPELAQSESIQTTPPASFDKEIVSREVKTPITSPNITIPTNNEEASDNSTSQSESNTTSETPASELPLTTDTPSAETPVCSSFDQAGLLATFDASLAAFIADATATYGSQYANLQYQLSSKNGTITAQQGTVTTNYSGMVQELSTGEDVSANGIITANFAWDGCVWQLVDYSF